MVLSLITALVRNLVAAPAAVLPVGRRAAGSVTLTGAVPFGSSGLASDGPVPGPSVPIWRGLAFPLGWPVGRFPGFSRRPILAVGGGGAAVTSQLL
ncbi:hypothetical protein ACWDZ8_25985 [Streptomyces sp. NPDC003233]